MPSTGFPQISIHLRRATGLAPPICRIVNHNNFASLEICIGALSLLFFLDIEDLPLAYQLSTIFERLLAPLDAKRRLYAPPPPSTEDYE